MQSPLSPSSDEPVLNTNGELSLDEETQRIAAQLREEAAVLADSALPHASYARLMQRIQTRPIHRRAAVWLAACAFAGCLLGVAGGYWLAHVRFASQDTKPAIVGRPSGMENAGPAAKSRGALVDAAPVADESWPFVNAQTPSDEGSPLVSYAQRIEVLERALERYQAALESQQERIRQLEAELEALRRSHRPPDRAQR